MNIFNSLGSNYTFSFALKHALTVPSRSAAARLKKLLAKKYGGEVTLTYKGREAITLALRAVAAQQKWLPEDTAVAVNGFTCFAVYEAVRAAGFQVRPLDINHRSLNFSAAMLADAVSNHPEIKIVIIQNTLGYACDIEGITAICRDRKLVLIEDLAHSIGTVYTSGREAGLTGDFTVLSMSQDKVVDGVSGGALVVRTKKFATHVDGEEKFLIKGRRAQLKDRWYPLLTWKIRATYWSGFGKIFHAVLRRLGALPRPVQPRQSLKHTWPYQLPSLHAQAILWQMQRLKPVQEHRRRIAEIYFQELDNRLLLYKQEASLRDASHLRFPIVVKERDKLIHSLKKHGVHVSDIWYDAPFAPKKYIHLTDYAGTCPNAEAMSAKILNLPTHVHVSEHQARRIAHLINTWVNEQASL